MISEGMAPYLKKSIVEDLVKSDLPFTLHFDETSTAQVKKQMDLTLQYWSPTQNKVWVTFYTSLFFGHAEGGKVASKMFEQLTADKIPVNKLIALVRDGPNVNKTIMRKLQECISVEYLEFGGFVDLGSCVLHTVHNAFGKGLEKYGKDIDQFCLDLHSLFKYSAARREDFKQLQLSLDVEMHTFQQHTEVCWLSIGPAIHRILEKWDEICEFIKLLSEDEKKAPKSVNYKRASAMLTGIEKDNTKAMLEFLNNTVPIFQGFLTQFQKSGPTVHILYDSMCQNLLKVLRRFMKARSLEGKYGSELAEIPCNDVKVQLSDSELNIGDDTRKALGKLKTEKQKLVFLGIRSYYAAIASHMQTKLPLSNTLLRDLGCLNPTKRTKQSTVVSIQNLSRKLQPQIDASILQDEWKVYQTDTDVDALQEIKDIEEYWNAVFQLLSINGKSRFQSLPLVVKSGLVLAQTNAESERSLSINARIVTKEKASLEETTIVGLHSVKEAVRFHDPVHFAPENIPITKELKLSVRAAHAAYQVRLEEERLEQERKKDEARRKREETDRKEKEKAKLQETKLTLAKSEEDLVQRELAARAELNAADELLNDATSKLHESLSGSITNNSVNKQSVNVATMMLDAAKNKREQAMLCLDEIRRKHRLLDSKRHKLLEKAIPSKLPATTKKKFSKNKFDAILAKKAKKS